MKREMALSFHLTIPTTKIREEKAFIRITFVMLLTFSIIAPAYGQLSGYTLEDTILVPPDDELVTSKVSLAKGIAYRLRASGEIPVGGGAFGDAEYLFRHASNGEHIPAYSNAPSIQSICPGTNPTDMGIGTNDRFNDFSKFPLWGGFENSHVYLIDFIGKGSPVTLNYHDCVHQDNSGFLTVEIFKPIQPPSPDVWTNPLTLTIIGGAISIAGGIIVTLTQRKKEGKGRKCETINMITLEKRELKEQV